MSPVTLVKPAASANMRGMIELDDLRCFVRIAEKRGVSAAARALDMPKSSVSRSLSRLETLLGADLFERQSGRLRLTEAGAAFLPRARRVLAELDGAEDAIAEVLGAPRGLLRVRATYSIAQVLVAPMLPGFWAKYPEIRVTLNAGDRPTDAAADEPDVVIRLGAPDTAASAARKLASVDLWTCASPAYLARRGVPRRVADLRGHDLVGVREPMRWRFTTADGAAASFEFAPRATVPEPATAQVLLLAGAAIGRLPDYLAAGAVADGTLVRVLGDLAPERVDLYAVAPRGRSFLTRARVFVDALADHLASRREPAAE